MSKRMLGWILSLVSVASVSVHAQPTGDIEWTTYGGDLASTRYSPADQIDASNFADLEIAWRLKTHNLGPTPEYNFQSTPLMVGGVIYTTAGTRRAVLAADAATGELLWMHRVDEGERAPPHRVDAPVAVWPTATMEARDRSSMSLLATRWSRSMRPLDSRHRGLATRASST